VSDVFILDASAVICLIDEEPGAEIVDKLLSRALMSAVNLAEVVSKLQERGGTDQMIDTTLAEFEFEIIEFDAEQAKLSGKLRNLTRTKGLSLGDRACLALAASRGAIAVTTDKAWKDFEHIARVKLVR
jgi:ribonuclease VapC